MCVPRILPCKSTKLPGLLTYPVSRVINPAKKDQTYALYNLTQEQLSHTLMPVGDYNKDEIRAIAEKIGIQVAHKRM